MENEQSILLTEFFPNGIGQFRPCAFFDERLDCIRVMTRDCSVLEERISPRVTVLMDNYADEDSADRYVGFSIKGARHFCIQHSLPLGTPIRIGKVLDALMESSPEVAVRLFVAHIARPLIEAEEIEEIEVPVAPSLA